MCIRGGCFGVMRRNVKIEVVSHRMSVAPHLYGGGIVQEVSVRGLRMLMVSRQGLAI